LETTTRIPESVAGREESEFGFLSAFRQDENGPQRLQQLLANVRTSLSRGTQLIFSFSSVAVTGMIVLNVLLKSVPLRAAAADAASEPSPG